ncbi:hypothetical protein KSS87_003876, partial [Heliosperma pusillum]
MPTLQIIHHKFYSRRTLSVLNLTRVKYISNHLMCSLKN